MAIGGAARAARHPGPLSPWSSRDHCRDLFGDQDTARELVDEAFARAWAS
jgi:hypothetical protein